MNNNNNNNISLILISIILVRTSFCITDSGFNFSQSLLAGASAVPLSSRFVLHHCFWFLDNHHRFQGLQFAIFSSSIFTYCRRYSRCLSASLIRHYNIYIISMIRYQVIILKLSQKIYI